MRDQRSLCGGWTRAEDIRPIPQNASVFLEPSDDKIDEARIIRVEIMFDSKMKKDFSLEKQISMVRDSMCTSSYLHIRRMHEASYSVSADITCSQFRSIENMSNVLSIKRIESAKLHGESFSIEGESI